GPAASTAPRWWPSTTNCSWASRASASTASSASAASAAAGPGGIALPRMSTAPDLSCADGLAPLERAARHPLMLGLFIPLQQGAWSPSTAPRSTSWDFEYNAECTVRAEELGFDLVFGLAQWLGKGGYGGAMRFRENATDPLLITAGLAPLTRNIILIS